MRKVFLVFLLFFLASCAGRSIAQADRVFIARVVFPDGTPAENVEVSLYAKDALFASEITDSEGLADFGELPIGLYTINAVIENYEGARKCNMVASNNPTYTCRVRLKLVECHKGERNCLSETAGEVCIVGAWQDFDCPAATFCSESKETKACVECRNDADCAVGMNCKAWQCIRPPECSPFERQCLSATTGKVCGAKGFWMESFVCPSEAAFCSESKESKVCVKCRTNDDCSAGQVCKGWECITPTECDPFERQCLTATTGKICNAQGFWGESFDCGQWGKVCSAVKGTKPCV